MLGWFRAKHLDVFEKIKENDVLIAFILAIVVSMIMLRYFYGADIKVLGNDVMAHIYKVWLLSNQIRNVSWPYWGLWDQNWYCGYPFLQLYAPLFYYASASLVVLLNLSPQDAVRVVTFVVYPLSAFIMYFCSLQITKNKLASVISSLSYATVPAFIADLATAGNPTVLLGFVLFPLLILFTERLTAKKGAEGVNFSIASLTLAAAILSAYRTGLAYTFSVFLFMVLNYAFLKRFPIKHFLIIPAAVLISTFFVAPALIYGMTVANISWPATEPLSALPFWFLIFLVPSNHCSLGVPLFIFGLLLPTFLMIRHRRGTDGVLEEKKLRIFFWCAIALFALTFSFIIPFHEHIPLLNNLLLGATVPALSFFAAILCGSCLVLPNGNSIIKTKISRRQVALVFAMILILFQAANVYTYHSPSPDQYMRVYDYIQSNDNGWFRAFQVPRQPSSSSISMFFDVIVLDGWFDQGATEGLEYFILRMMGFAEPKGRPYGWGDFYASPSKALSALRILGVKYVIVDSADPVFPPDVSKTIFWGVNRSDLVERVAGPFGPSDSIYIFKLKGWYPVIAASMAFVINDDNELAIFYDIVSNRTFNPTSAVFISRSEVYNEIPWQNWTGKYPIVAESVNLTIHQLVIDDMTFQINFEVNRSSFLYIPISCFPNLQVTLNGVETRTFKALPDFFTLYLPSKGLYNLTISRVMTSLEAALLLLSSITLGGVILTGIISTINYYRKKTTEGI